MLEITHEVAAVVLLFKLFRRTVWWGIPVLQQPRIAADIALNAERLRLRD